MVEQRLFWEKYRDESDSRFPTYTYRVGMTTSSHSFNGMIWKTIQSSLPPEEELKMLQQLYPTYDMIDGMMGFYKREHESTTTYQWWDDALKKYRPYPFDCCSEELFDWERNKDVGYDEKIFALENGHKFVPIPGDDIKPDYHATFMFMREPKWHYTVDGCDWL